MTNNQELKPCPFCGGEAVFATRSNNSGHHHVGFSFEINCKDCGIKLPKWYNVEFFLTESGEIDLLNDERKKAIEAWNRRAENER